MDVKNRTPLRVFLGTLLVLALAAFGFSRWEERSLRRDLLPIAEGKLVEYKAHAHRPMQQAQVGGISMIQMMARMNQRTELGEDAGAPESGASEDTPEAAPAISASQPQASTGSETPTRSAPPVLDAPLYDVVSTVEAARRYVLFGEALGKVSLYFRARTPDGPGPYSAVEFSYTLDDGAWEFAGSSHVGEAVCREAAIKAFNKAESEAG